MTGSQTFWLKVQEVVWEKVQKLLTGGFTDQAAFRKTITYLPNDHSVWIAAIGFDGSANKCESNINTKSLSYHKISQRHVCRICDILHLWKGIKKLDGVAKLITDSPPTSYNKIVTHDKWHMTGRARSNYSQSFSWSFGKKGHSVNQSIG